LLVKRECCFVRAILDLVENLKVGKYLKDLGVDGRIVFKKIFEKWEGGHLPDRSGSGSDR
jgi:hypothetical protein